MSGKRGEEMAGEIKPKTKAESDKKRAGKSENAGMRTFVFFVQERERGEVMQKVENEIGME